MQNCKTAKVKTTMCKVGNEHMNVTVSKQRCPFILPNFNYRSGLGSGLEIWLGLGPGIWLGIGIT